MVKENNLNKKQPSNIEAEQALIGSILVTNEIFDEIGDDEFNEHNPPLFKKKTLH